MTARTANTSIFALRLAQARERSGLTQTELGLRAGLDPTVASPRINQYERGKHEPQHKTAKRLAEVLGVPPAFLYTEDEALAQVLLHWEGLKPKERMLVAMQVSNLVGTQLVTKPKRGSASTSKPGLPARSRLRKER